MIEYCVDLVCDGNGGALRESLAQQILHQFIRLLVHTKNKVFVSQSCMHRNEYTIYLLFEGNCSLAGRLVHDEDPAVCAECSLRETE